MNVSPAAITPEVRDAFGLVQERLGSCPVLVFDRWAAIGAALGVEDAIAVGRSMSGDAFERTLERAESMITIGPIDTLSMAAFGSWSGTHLGFVAPGATRRAPWQRESSEFADPTMRLWRSGWSPSTVVRCEVAIDDATVELVIGDARPTPTVEPSSD